MFPNKLKDLSVLVEKLKDLVTELSFFTLNIRFLIMIERKTRRLYVKNIKIQQKKKTSILEWEFTSTCCASQIL